MQGQTQPHRPHLLPPLLLAVILTHLLFRPSQNHSYSSSVEPDTSEVTAAVLDSVKSPLGAGGPTFINRRGVSQGMKSSTTASVILLVVGVLVFLFLSIIIGITLVVVGLIVMYFGRRGSVDATELGTGEPANASTSA